MANLLEIPLRSRGPLSVLLFLDLGRPEHFQQVLEPLLAVCRQRQQQQQEEAANVGQEKQPSETGMNRVPSAVGSQW